MPVAAQQPPTSMRQLHIPTPLAADTTGPTSYPLPPQGRNSTSSILSTVSTAAGAPRLSLSQQGLGGGSQAGSSVRQYGVGSTPPGSTMARPASSSSLLALRPSGESTRSALLVGSGASGPTPRSSGETTGSNIQQPGFVRRRIRNWAARLMGKAAGGSGGSSSSSKYSSRHAAPEVHPGHAAASGVAGFAAVDLSPLQEVAPPHLTPQSHPLLLANTLRASQDTQGSQLSAVSKGLRTSPSSFNAAGVCACSHTDCLCCKNTSAYLLRCSCVSQGLACLGAALQVQTLTH